MQKPIISCIFLEFLYICIGNPLITIGLSLLLMQNSRKLTKIARDGDLYQDFQNEKSIFCYRIKTWWKLCLSSFYKSMVSLCSGEIEAMKVYIYFCVTAKPMNTTRKWSSFVKSHLSFSRFPCQIRLKKALKFILNMSIYL